MPRPLLARLLVLGLGALLLTGCLLQSARQVAITPSPAGGAVHHIAFFSSDTLDSGVIQEIDVDQSAVSLEVTVAASVGSGELRIELLRGNDDTVALEVTSTGKPATATGLIRTGDTGILRYRVWATNARNGDYSIAFGPPPTPTPTPTPTSTPVFTPTSTPTETPTPTQTPLPTETLEFTPTLSADPYPVEVTPTP